MPEDRNKGQKIEDAGFDEYCVWHAHQTEDKGSRYKDPIIYSTHPDVVSLKTELLTKGTFHDANNNTSILSLVPSWIIEEDEINADVTNRDSIYNTNLRQMCHIMGTYFDKIRLYIDAMPTFKQPMYASGSDVPVPFARHLPQSLGLITPELFVDSQVIERFLNLTPTGSFEGSLFETKNSGVEAAMNWVMEHMGDANFNDPFVDPK